MGSTAELMIVGGGGAELAEWAHTRIEQLEAMWSRFRHDSELNRICRLAGAGPVPASAETVAAIGHALALWYVTDGRFDASIRAALEACGYDQTFRLVAPNGPAARPPRPVQGCEGVRVDRDRSTVTLPAGMCLDLGGIGKGLAADLVATGLVERGALGACVALGGDVRVAGYPPDGRAWSIPIEDPLAESRTIGTRALVDAAVVTSSTRVRQWRRGDTAMHHLIDPATGAPARRGVSAVIAQADEAWWAEGVAKAAVVSGAQDGLDLLERLGIAAVVVGDDGTYRFTSRWEHA
ncbi:MAG TPA: FAD:protein FMN transferase [Acidimicrobiia bacterium]|nr:FAD:protein FMN transferase [Acidimicrobiia bacterium]